MRTGMLDESLELEEQIREVVCRMKRNVSGVPEGVRDFFYDLCREEPRVKRAMGRYPHIAFAFARDGAPYSDVVAPMNHLKARLLNDVYLAQTVCIMEAISGETNANALQDHMVNYYLNEPTASRAEALADACAVQRTETRKVEYLARRHAVKGD